MYQARRCVHDAGVPCGGLVKVSGWIGIGRREKHKCMIPGAFPLHILPQNPSPHGENESMILFQVIDYVPNCKGCRQRVEAHSSLVS